MNPYLQPAVNVFTQLPKQTVGKLAMVTLLQIAQAFVSDHLVPVSILCLLIFIDWLFGLSAAVVHKTFTSTGFRKTAVKLGAYVLLIATLHIAGFVSPIINVLALDSLMVLYLVATELISVSENFTLLTGISIPSWLKTKLKGVTGSTDKKDS